MFRIFLFLLAAVFPLSLLTGCEEENYAEEDCYDYDYSDCNTIEPLESTLRIKLTINGQNPEVEIVVFNGKAEAKDTFSVTTVTDPVFYQTVPLNAYYSASATYNVDGKTIIATDGDRISSTSSVVCDSTCWSISGGYIDIRLKYDNF
ncbi:MAG: hypothetical protein ABIJ16_02000 [Bacteroidota bacterium]